LLITDSDLDGLGSAVLAKAYGIEYDHIELSVPCKMNTSEMMTLIEPYDNITVADLSFDEEHMNEIMDKGKKIVVYDHHLTSSYLNNHAKYPGCISDPSRCGTRIYFEEVIVNKCGLKFNEATIKFITLVDTYDRWVQKSRFWQEASKLNRVYLFHKREPWSFINYYAEKIKEYLFYFTYEDEQKAKYIADEINGAYKYSESLMKVYGTADEKYGVSFHTGYCSDVGSELIKKHGLTYIILIDSIEHAQVSIRSVSEFDCTQFEGIKGHKNAAGGRFPPGYLDEVYEGKPMKPRTGLGTMSEIETN